MKAVVYQRYGSPDVLELREIPKPTPKDDEVLVKLHAVSLNASDWEILRGKPAYARIYGLLKPKIRILGSDIAGSVEAVGGNVTQFQPGDEVFGDTFGSFGGFAEYVCARDDKLMLKPATITMEQAAALPQAGVIALQGLRDKGQILPGQKVLINGAGGSGGTFAIQLAKMFGADVTGIDRTSKLDMMRSIGADHVIDYTQEDFAQSERRYDLIFDFVAHRSMFDHMRVLAPTGRYVLAGGSMYRLLQTLIVGSMVSKFGRKKMRVLDHHQNKKDMGFMAELHETGKVSPVIDRYFPLREVPEALQFLGDGLAKGKVVITMDHNNQT
jgi:NADPH:quinone reductase-like Zn-dependent oxidoreductase